MGSIVLSHPACRGSVLVGHAVAYVLHRGYAGEKCMRHAIRRTLETIALWIVIVIGLLMAFDTC